MRFLLPPPSPPLPPLLLPASVQSPCRGPRGLQMGQPLSEQPACGCSSAAAAAMKASVMSSSYTVSAASSTCTAGRPSAQRTPGPGGEAAFAADSNGVACRDMRLHAAVCICRICMDAPEKHVEQTMASIPPPAAVHGGPQRSSRVQPPTVAAHTLCSVRQRPGSAPRAAASLAAGLSSPGSGPSQRHRRQGSWQRLP